MPRTILMLATFGLEIVEVGGTLALHAEAGDQVRAAVLLARPAWRGQIEAAAQLLGVGQTRFLDFATGTVTPDVPAKRRLVGLLREWRPDILITQDPEHAAHDLDPDRRLAMLLYLEAVALAGRDWDVEECGGHRPHSVGDLYYMTPEAPNCVVDIRTTFARKAAALAVLDYQAEFSAQVLRELLGEEGLQALLPDYATLAGDAAALGRALLQAGELARALHMGLGGHTRAGLAEAFRHQGPFTLDRLR